MKDSLRSSFFTTPRFHQKIHLPTWLTNASFGSHHIDHIGGAMCPSWKMMELVNGKDDIPYMENKNHVWNHQPDIDHIDHTWITEIDPIDPLSIHPIAARFSPISKASSPRSSCVPRTTSSDDIKKRLTKLKFFCDWKTCLDDIERFFVGIFRLQRGNSTNIVGIPRQGSLPKLPILAVTPTFHLQVVKHSTAVEIAHCNASGLSAGWDKSQTLPSQSTPISLLTYILQCYVNYIYNHIYILHILPQIGLAHTGPEGPIIA